MLQLLGVFVTVAVPALVAYGSSSRRRLGLIRDELKTLDAIPESHSAHDVLSKQIAASVNDYADRRKQSPYGLIGIFGLTLAYFSLAFGILVLTNRFSGVLREVDDRGRTALGVALMVLAIIGMSIVMTRVIYLRTLRRKRTAKDSDAELHSPPS